MVDLKLIAKSEEEFQKEIQIVKVFMNDIYIEFGLGKYAKITFKRGELNPSQNLAIVINREIQN
jgi:hypothetical protein